MYKGFQSEGQMGRKQMSTKWGHILSGVAFEFNCIIGKTHILSERGTLYIHTVTYIQLHTYSYMHTYIHTDRHTYIHRVTYIELHT